MKLYNRDYSKISSQDEREAVELQAEFDNKKGIKCTSDSPDNSLEDKEIRRFLWNYNSLFPNNYLWHIDAKEISHEDESNQFKDIVYSANNEEDIQQYIKNNKKWFIPAALYKDYNFGHHGAYLFPEMQLGSEYKADYGLLGKNSDGYHMVLVEFENSNTPFLVPSTETEADSVRKGIKQIRDWKSWIDKNRDYFHKSHKFTSKGIEIPSYRFHYCLVVSRRDKMTDKAKDVRSIIISENKNTLIVTYDRIIDNILKIGNGY